MRVTQEVRAQVGGRLHEAQSFDQGQRSDAAAALRCQIIHRKQLEPNTQAQSTKAARRASGGACLKERLPCCVEREANFSIWKGCDVAFLHLTGDPSRERRSVKAPY